MIQTSAANFSLNNSKKLKPVQIRSNPLSTYNQQLWLTCVVELEPSEETSIQTSFPMTVKVDGVSQDATTMYIHNKVHNRTRTLTCAGVSVFDAPQSVISHECCHRPAACTHTCPPPPHSPGSCPYTSLPYQYSHVMTPRGCEWRLWSSLSQQ